VNADPSVGWKGEGKQSQDYKRGGGEEKMYHSRRFPGYEEAPHRGCGAGGSTRGQRAGWGLLLIV